MNTFFFPRRRSQQVAVAITALFFSAVTSHALPLRIFVASYGKDSNPGTLSSPKRHFQAAHTWVAPGGEIVVLNTGNYGSLDINKSVDVTAPEGVLASINLAGSGSGITINAASTDYVNLRGLSITTAATAQNHGILCVSVGSLTIRNCTFKGLAFGVDFVPANNNATLLMDHCTVRNCGAGVRSQPAGSTMGIIRDSAFIGNNNGATFNGFNRFSITDSVLTENGTAVNATGHDAHVLLKRCQISANATGLSCIDSPSCIIRVDACSLVFHKIDITGTALFTKDGGRILSRGNNILLGNSFDGSFTGTYAPL